MKFFIAQLNPIVGDLDGNANKILHVSGKAHSNSADMVLTPELSLWGYPPRDLLLKKNLVERQYSILDQLSISINNKYGDLSVTVGIAEKIDDSFSQIFLILLFLLKVASGKQLHVKLFSQLMKYLMKNDTFDLSKECL